MCLIKLKSNEKDFLQISQRFSFFSWCASLKCCRIWTTELNISVQNGHLCSNLRISLFLTCFFKWCDNPISVCALNEHCEQLCLRLGFFFTWSFNWCVERPKNLKFAPNTWAHKNKPSFTLSERSGIHVWRTPYESFSAFSMLYKFDDMPRGCKKWYQRIHP